MFLLIGKTSALTMNIAGVIKDWLLIFCSYYLVRAPVTALNLLGYAFCCAGVCPSLRAVMLAPEEGGLPVSLQVLVARECPCAHWSS